MFLAPDSFWLLLLLVPLGGLMYSRYKSGVKDLKNLGGSWRETNLLNVFVVKWFFSSLSIVLFFILAVLAMGKPVWGSYPEVYNPGGLDIVFAVDVSRSMNAPDIVPTRLSKAKTIIHGLVEGLPANRFSVVVFKGKGVVAVPATEDSVTLYNSIERLSSEMLSLASSNLEDGLRAALDAFPTGADTKKAVVLITDGESIYGQPLTAANLASRMGITIYTVGAGTPEGRTIPMAEGRLILDGEGKPVITKLNRPLLEEIAEISGGRYFSLSDPLVLAKLLTSIQEDFISVRTKGFKVSGKEQYRGFLSFASISLFIMIIIRVVRWKNTF